MPPRPSPRSSIRSRLAACSLVASSCAALALVAATWSPRESANLERIASMPVEQRQALMAKLAEFDALPADQRAEIKAIDDKLRALPPADQDRLRAELRRYALWLQSLPLDQRDALREAKNPAAWRPLAVEFRKTQQQQQEGSQSDRIANPRELLGRTHDQFGSFSLLEDLVLLKAWKTLSPQEQTQIAKKTKNERFALRKAIRERDPSIENSLRKSIESSIEDLRTAFKEAIPQDAPPQFRFRRMMEKAAAARKEFENRKGLEKGAPGIAFPPAYTARFELKLLEAMILTESKLRDVSDERLERFHKQELPDWEKTALEDLSPAAARRALLVLYRYFYPFPNEIADPKPSAKAKKAAAGPEAAF